MTDLIIYNTEDGKSKVALFVQKNEVWLTQNQYTEHIKNILKDKELDEFSVMKNFFITATDGKSYSTKRTALAMLYKKI